MHSRGEKYRSALFSLPHLLPLEAHRRLPDRTLLPLQLR